MFRLTKWYVDCVGDDGVACVGYWAELRWKRIAISYTAVLLGGNNREHLLAVDAPCVNDDVLTWRAEPLQCDFSLRRRAPSFERILSPGVTWRCLMPSADATAHVGDREIRGRGYAEVLELEVAPWKLPIEELRWGRFTGDARSIVWINWRGTHPLTVIVLDGIATEGAVDDGTITAGDLTLTIREDMVIRNAPLSKTLAAIPVVASLARANETKWCGRGTVYRNKETVDRGWVVHETVRFA